VQQLLVCAAAVAVAAAAAAVVELLLWQAIHALLAGLPVPAVVPVKIQLKHIKMHQLHSVKVQYKRVYKRRRSTFSTTTHAAL
jgi:gentisate 1,2-dioxygenase